MTRAIQKAVEEKYLRAFLDGLVGFAALSGPPFSDPPSLKRSPPSQPYPAKPPVSADIPRPNALSSITPTPSTTCKPTACRNCQQPLHGDDPQPLRHQVRDVPPVRLRACRPRRTPTQGRLRLADGSLSLEQGQSRPLVERPVLYPALRRPGLRYRGGGRSRTSAGCARIAGGGPTTASQRR